MADAPQQHEQGPPGQGEEAAEDPPLSGGAASLSEGEPPPRPRVVCRLCRGWAPVFGNVGLCSLCERVIRIVSVLNALRPDDEERVELVRGFQGLLDRVHDLRGSRFIPDLTGPRLWLPPPDDGGWPAPPPP
eukprot:8358958-Alexandrium_andersonii.AAC.1